MPGVTVEDMGHKMGLNGVDNAKLTFDKVRVPRENLLNKYSDVSPGLYLIEFIFKPKTNASCFFLFLLKMVNSAHQLVEAGKDSSLLLIK